MNKNNKILSVLMKVGCMANGVLGIVTGCVFIGIVGTAGLIQKQQDYGEYSEMIDQADAMFKQMQVWSHLFYGTFIIAGVLAFAFLLFNVLKKEEKIFGWIEFALQMIVVVFGVAVLYLASLIRQIANIGTSLVFDVGDSSYEVWQQSHHLVQLANELAKSEVYVFLYLIMLFFICISAVVALVFLILSIVKKDPQPIQKLPEESLPIPSAEPLPELPSQENLPDLPNMK